jgi:hypothetical protein
MLMQLSRWITPSREKSSFADSLAHEILIYFVAQQEDKPQRTRSTQRILVFSVLSVYSVANSSNLQPYQVRWRSITWRKW